MFSHVFRSSRPEILSFGFLWHFFSGGSLSVGSEEVESTCASFLGLELFSKVGFVAWDRWMVVDSSRVDLICAKMILEPAHNRLRGWCTLYLLCFNLLCFGLGYNDGNVDRDSTFYIAFPLVGIRIQLKSS